MSDLLSGEEKLLMKSYRMSNKNIFKKMKPKVYARLRDNDGKKKKKNLEKKFKEVNKKKLPQKVLKIEILPDIKNFLQLKLTSTKFFILFFSFNCTHCMSYQPLRTQISIFIRFIAFNCRVCVQSCVEWVFTVRYKKNFPQKQTRERKKKIFFESFSYLGRKLV